MVERLIAEKANVDALNSMSETPLMMAAMYLCVGAVKTLLAAGADKSKVCWRGKV